MYTEDDWLLNQFKGIGKFIGESLSHQKISEMDLGSYVDEQGQSIDIAKRLAELLVNKEVRESAALIASLKFVTSYYDYSLLKSNYEAMIRSLSAEEMTAQHLSEEELNHLSNQLESFLDS